MSEIYSGKTFYVYRDRTSDFPPIKEYNVKDIVYYSDSRYIYIERSIPISIHFAIAVLLICALSVIYWYLHRIDNEYSIHHVVQVPSVMYYDEYLGTLDVDICNNSNNVSPISFSILDEDGYPIYAVSGVLPGSTVGSIPIGEYVFEDLPMECTVEYKVLDSFKYEPLYFDVLVVSSSAAEGTWNYEF